MTNSEKDELAGEIGTVLPINEQQYDEMGAYNPTGEVIDWAMKHMGVLK